MPTKPRALGNKDRARRDAAVAALEAACKIINGLLSPYRPMTEAEKVGKLKDLLIALLGAVNQLILMGSETVEV